MDKRQLIEAVRQFNPSATARFLNQFDAASLRQYLQRLEDTHARTKQICSWVKRRPQELRVAS